MGIWEIVQQVGGDVGFIGGDGGDVFELEGFDFVWCVDVYLFCVCSCYSLCDGEEFVILCILVEIGYVFVGENGGCGFCSKC